MLEHKPGFPSAEYSAKIPYFIIAALGVDKTESIKSIGRKTGFNPTTVAAYIKRLVADGTVQKVPSGAVRYKLAEPKKKVID
jgi:DNA-binding MarR family transcriptional regulator